MFLKGTLGNVGNRELKERKAGTTEITLDHRIPPRGAAAEDDGFRNSEVWLHWKLPAGSVCVTECEGGSRLKSSSAQKKKRMRCDVGRCLLHVGSTERVSGEPSSPTAR